MTKGRLKILLPIAISAPLDYWGAGELMVGQMVMVPFGRKQLIGVVWPGEPDPTLPDEKVREILEILPDPPLPQPLIQLIEFMASYYIQPLGLVAKLALFMPAKLKKPPKINPFSYHINQHILPNPSQQLAIDSINQHINDQKFQPICLHGITGSGKTLVYCHAILCAWQMGKNAMVLIPEIAQTFNIAKQLGEFLGINPPIWHSNISIAQKRALYNGLTTKNLPIIIGARSALCLPMDNIGVIIVDEEHDGNYKQSQGIRYYARDMAIKLAQLHQCPVVLGSATPSCETMIQAMAGQYKYIALDTRVGKAELPNITLVDMRNDILKRDHYLSPTFIQQLDIMLDKGRQSLVFLNRRGFAPLLLCKHCGHRYECPDCSSFLAMHKKPARLECGLCAHTMPVPQFCAQCQSSDGLIGFGVGVEKISEEILSHFPNARIAIASSDTMNGDTDWQLLYQKSQNNQLDIIIGTQIMTKGHNFPLCDFVGIVSADALLSNPDPRAMERAFQIMQQVIGRAGRQFGGAQAIIQTYNPEDSLLQAIAQYDNEQFIKQELSRRHYSQMPPFARLCAIIISGADAQKTLNIARQLAQQAPKIDEYQLLGPAPAPIFTLRGQYRYRFLVKCPRNLKIHHFMQAWIQCFPPQWRHFQGVQIEIDIDPQDFF